MTKPGSIYWLNFSPTIGTEIKKIRPALIIFTSTKRIIVLPITSNVKKIHAWQLVIKDLVKDKDGKILFDQIRSFDKQRLLRKIGIITKLEMELIKQKLKKIFELVKKIIIRAAKPRTNGKQSSLRSASL